MSVKLAVFRDSGGYVIELKSENTVAYFSENTVAYFSENTVAESKNEQGHINPIKRLWHRAETVFHFSNCINAALV